MECVAQLVMVMYVDIRDVNTVNDEHYMFKSRASMVKHTLDNRNIRLVSCHENRY